MDVVCNICAKKSVFVFSAILLQKYDVKYYHCSNCGFLQTEEPYWLEEAYKDPINIEDTGLIGRNILLSKRTSLILFLLFNRKGRFLDYAGGDWQRLQGQKFLWSKAGDPRIK